jgi:hypothetical protein
MLMLVLAADPHPDWPPLSDLKTKFGNVGDHASVRAQQKQAGLFVEYLVTRAVRGVPVPDDVFSQASRTNKAYDALRCALDPDIREEDRRLHLAHLRFHLGKEAYAAGRMLPLIPAKYEKDCRRWLKERER